MSQTKRSLILSFFANTALTFMKIIVGILGKSQSLIADGFHSFSDLATDIIALVGNRMAGRPADKEHPFGHGKIEYITSLLIGIMVFGVGISLIKASIQSTNFFPDQKILFVIVLVILIKYIVAMYLLRTGKKEKNQILISSGKESLMDVISSIFVWLIVILSQFQSKIPIFAYLDRVGGVLIGMIILGTGISLIKDNISILIGRIEEDNHLTEQIRNTLETLDIKMELEQIVLMSYGPYHQADFKVQVPSKMTMEEFEDEKDTIKQYLKQDFPKIKYINYHITIKK